MPSVKIIDVKKDGNLISVFKEITDDDGNVHINQHLFTDDTVEWRAAEYGTRDMDLILDIILYEPFTDPEEFGSLYDHDSPAKALEAHTRVIADKKNQVRKLAATASVGSLKKSANDLAKEDEEAHVEFYSRIKEACLFDEENLGIKSDHINSVFRAKAEEARLTRTTKRESPRGERLRALLAKPGKSEA